MEQYEVIVEVRYCGGKVEHLRCLNTDARRIVEAQATWTHKYGNKFDIVVFGHSETWFSCENKRAVHNPHGGK